MKILFVILACTLSTASVAMPKNMIEVLKEKGNFSTLIEGLERSDIADTIKKGYHYTLFAPTDEAFNAMTSESINEIFNDRNRLKSVLKYHIAKPALNKRSLLRMNGIKTLSGKFITNKSTDWNIMLNDSKLVSGNHYSFNGIVHIIDKVLIPDAYTSGNEIQTVSSVDLERYMGHWYEIYRIPNKFEQGCFDVTAEYRQEGEKVKVLNTCFLGDGSKKTAKGTAFVTNTDTNAELKVSFVPILQRWGLFAGDYNILALSDDYEYALVGSKDRDYLWILARSENLSEAIVEELFQVAERQGYNTNRLIKTPSLKIQ